MAFTLLVPSSVYAEATVEDSPYKSYCAIGDSFSAGYGPLMGNNSWSNFFFNKPTAGSFASNLLSDLGLTNDDFNSLICVDLLLRDAYYAIGGDPDPVMDPEDISSTVSYYDDAKAYHDYDGSDYMSKLEEKHNGEGAEDIANSDLITMLVGLADISVYPVDRASQVGDTSEETIAALITAGLYDDAQYLQKMLARMRDLNPDAEIVLLSVFNPYAKWQVSGDKDTFIMNALNKAFDTLNTYIKMNAATYNCTYVDITGVSQYIDNDVTVIEEGELLDSLENHENHFGAAGQEYVEQQILNALGLEIGSKTPSTDNDTSYLAFTSDTHVADNGYSTTRLDNWLDTVSDELGDITFDYMGFCGDLASAYLGSSAYASKIQMLMDTINKNTNVEAGIYTTGNHEYSPGQMATNSAYEPYASITRLGEAANTDVYQIFCFGSAQYNQQFNDDDIQALSDYLATADKTKPVFVMSHFPLHSFGTRTSTNADKVIEVLNNYSNVIFLWGHNHTESDTHYDQVITDSLDGTPINFIYCAAGCMSDADYSSGSDSVDGKGLVAAIDGDSTLTLTYYDEEGAVVSSYLVNIETADADEIDIASQNMPANYDGNVWYSASTLGEGQYVLTVGKMAMNNQTHDGYTTVNNSITYTYPGLQGAKIGLYQNNLTAGLTEDEVWKVEKVSNGYTIQDKDGKYLTGYYYSSAGDENHPNQGAWLKLEDTSNANSVWTYTDGHIKNVATGKYLNYEVDGDVDGTLTAGSTNVFTLRSASDDTVSLYTSTVAQESSVVTNYSAASSFTDGSWYLLTAEDYAVTSTYNDGYVTVNGSTYKYSGLDGKAITASGNYVTSKVTTSMLWQAEAVDGGFALKNTEGKYLDASYSTTTSGYAGVGALYVGDEAQAWVLSGTTLKNVSSGKYFNYQNSSDIDGTKQSGSSDFFTVRSSSKDEVKVYLSADGSNEEIDKNEVIDTDSNIAKTEVEPFYSLISSSTLENGSIVIFTSSTKYMTDSSNEGYTTSNNYHYSGLDAGDLGATAGADLSTKNINATEWTVEVVDASANTYRFKNSEGKYLTANYKSGTDYGTAYTYEGRVTLEDEASDYNKWTLSLTNNVVDLTNAGCGKHLKYDNDIVFTVRPSTSGMYMYQKTEKSYELESTMLNDGATVVFAYNEYFMGSGRGIGYKNKISSGAYYQYSGLVASNLGATASTSLTTLPSATNDMLWTVEKVDGGYRFKNANGRYLSGSYTTGNIDVTEDGEDLTVAATGIGKVTLVATPDDSCIWTVSFSDKTAYLANVKSGKYLTYNSSSDVDGTCLDPTDSSVSVFTVRSFRTHSLYNSLYIYQEKERVVTEIESGHQYVMVNSEGYAVSSNKGTGYNDVNSTYRYDGLAPANIEISDGKISSTFTTDLVWTFTASGDGYTIQNAEGQYLNSVYKDVAGGAEDSGVNLTFSDNSEVWYIVNGYIKSESTGKYLSRQTNSGSANLFTLRSSTANAQTFSFYGLSEANTRTALYTHTVGGTLTNTREVLSDSTSEFTGSTATALKNYTFVGWYQGETKLSEEATYVPTKTGVYEARFEENTRHITYQAALTKDAEGAVIGNLDDLKLSSTGEDYGIVSGIIKGSTAPAVTGYTFLYWTSDEAGNTKVSLNKTYVPKASDDDATYYAWYEKEIVCSENVFTPITLTSGSYEMLINGTDCGKYVFTASGSGWTIYDSSQKKFISCDSNYALTYSNVSKVWNYDSKGFYVTSSTSFLWWTFTTNHYITVSNGSLTMSTTAPSSTKAAEITKVGYYEHGDLVTSTSGHVQVCQRCGQAIVVENTDHTYVYTDNGNGTHTGKCECGAVTATEAHTNGDLVNLNDTQHQTTCSVCGSVTTSNHVLTYTDNGDGTHTATCTCDYSATVPHVYDSSSTDETKKCVDCGAELIAYISDVTAVQTLTTTSGYWTFSNWWFRYVSGSSKYTVTITATPVNTTVAKIEYSLDGKTYITGSSVSSTSKISKIYVRVTDGNGVVNTFTVTPTGL